MQHTPAIGKGFVDMSRKRIVDNIECDFLIMPKQCHFDSFLSDSKKVCYIMTIKQIIIKYQRKRHTMATFTIGLAEAKKNFSKLTAEVNRTGKPVTVLKNNKPWVVILPAVSFAGDQEDVAVDLLDNISYSMIEI